MKPEQTFNEAAYEIAAEIATLVIRKQLDYGKDNILGSPGGPGTGVLVRLWDKINRLKNLMSKSTVHNETTDDTYIDIMGYGLLGVMLARKKFDLEIVDIWDTNE